MLVYLTKDISIEVEKKFDAVSPYHALLKEFFSDRFYGEDLITLYISVLCWSPKFEHFFKLRKPNYKSEGKVYIHQGVQVEREAMSLTYDLKLNYDTYLNAPDIKPVLAQDILKSLDTISTIKKIKDFNISEFKSDFKVFFQQNGWL